MRYLTQKCDRCSETASISLQEIVENKNTRGIPKDWKYRDIGIDAEESYLICYKCMTEYNKVEATAFREFIKSNQGTTKTP